MFVGMKKIFWGIGLFLIGLVVGAVVYAMAFAPTSFVPPLKVIGDVEQPLSVQDLRSLGQSGSVTAQNIAYQAVPMSEVLQQACPMGNPQEIHLVSNLDGFSAVLAYADINECYITFTPDNGWEAVNPKHPNSSNAKFLSEIRVVTELNNPATGFSVISADADLAHTTPGQLLTKTLQLYPYHEGASVAQHDGKDYSSQVVTWRRMFNINDLTPLKDNVSLMAVNAEGASVITTDAAGYFEVRDNSVNYLQTTSRTTLENIKGVIVHPPAANISDTFYAARHYLENKEPLLIVIIDGLTYQQYATVADNDSISWLKKIGAPVQAVGVYPADYQTGLRAILTGYAAQDSDEDNISNIFALAKELNLKAVFLDAAPDDGSLATSYALTENAVDYQNIHGSADDVLPMLTEEAIQQQPALLVLRFHNVAQARSASGPNTEASISAISVVDQCLEDISARWSGQLIITGAQSTGLVSTIDAPKEDLPQYLNSEVMFIPYWRLGTER